MLYHTPLIEEYQSGATNSLVSFSKGTETWISSGTHFSIGPSLSSITIRGHIGVRNLRRELVKLS